MWLVPLVILGIILVISRKELPESVEFEIAPTTVPTDMVLPEQPPVENGFDKG